MTIQDFAMHANWLVAAAGLGEVRAVDPLVGGANNRVFRIEADAGSALLKAYFRHPDDTRDRLGAEFGFSRFAWDRGVRALPRPLACDPEAGLGLFEYVEGRRLQPGEVDAAAVDQAAAFFHQVNQARFDQDAAALPPGSEACFSLADHVNLVRRRVNRLADLPAGSSIVEAARDFVNRDLTPASRSIFGWVEQKAMKANLRLDLPLASNERCLSPSDFGYHNALLATDGRLRFVDFEYAGWDDPARMVADFFSQPAVPVPTTHFDRFSRSIASNFPNSAIHVERARLLFPVYRLKWCCIMLNEFLPTGSQRRQFSGSPAEQEERKAMQLDKAREALAWLRQWRDPAE